MTEARRDRWGRYLVVPPNGGTPTGYTRATTVAKALDDGGGLLPWKATATVVGAMRRPGLHARWQALINEHPDPWYSTNDSKTACKKLVEECATAGGSTDRADLGTALHAIVEQASKTPGGGVPILQPGMQADVDAYMRTLDAAGIIVDPAMVEAMVVLDEHQVAGTSDNLSLYVPGYGNVVGDLKTGTDLKYSWQAIAIQLAIYAHSDNVYAQGDAGNGSQDRRLAMPKLNQEVGLVIHLPAGEARCELHLVDLVAGWDAFLQSMWTRKWRTRRDLARPLSTSPAMTAPAAEVVSPAGTVRTANAATVPAAIEPPDFDAVSTPAVASLVSGAADVEPVGPASSAATSEPPDFDTVATSTPTPPSPPEMSASPGDGHRAPVSGATPAEQHADVATSPDEGGPADPAAARILELAYQQLSAAGKTWIARFASEAIQHHVSFHLKTVKTVRRFEILRGLIALSQTDSLDDETIRCVVAAVIGDPAHFPAVTVGHLIGSLDADRAAQFAACCVELATTTVPCTVTGDGRVHLQFTGLAAAAA